MLTTARETLDVYAIVYCQGRADGFGFRHRHCGAVTAFQAFHWFDGPAALAEFNRILEPRGWLALIWNDRDDSDPLTAAYHQILTSTPQAQAIANSWRQSSAILSNTPWFERPRTFTFPLDQVLEEEGLIGRAFSASYAPREPALVEKTKLALRELFARYQVNGISSHALPGQPLFLARRMERG